MDASQITKLLQKQNTRHLQRSQTVDSSTLTWKQQIQSSTYVRGLHTTQSAPSCVTGGQCYYGGQGKQTTLITGSTQMYPNVFASASGSASEVYSADQLLLQTAGKHACAIQTEWKGSIELPYCFCENTNVPSENSTQINPQTNPYLPPFDTFYRFKNPQISQPIQDVNKKHHLTVGRSRFSTSCDGCILEQE